MNTYAIILSAVTLSFGSACAATLDSPAIEPHQIAEDTGRLDKMSVSPSDYMTPCPNNNGLGFVNQSGTPSALPTPVFASVFASPAIGAQTAAEGQVEPAMTGIEPSEAVVLYFAIGKAPAAGISPIIERGKAPAARVSPIVPMQPAS